MASSEELVSGILYPGYKIPLTNSSDDAIAVQRAWDFNEGWFATPTFLRGDYPKLLKGIYFDISTEFHSRRDGGHQWFIRHFHARCLHLNSQWPWTTASMLIW